MRIAVLSDIHGNLPALEAVLRDIPEDVGGIWCLGDVVNYYAQPHACVAALRADPRVDAGCWLLGNHDAAVVGLADAARLNPYGQATLAFTREQLTADDQAWLRARPLVRALRVDGLEITLAHGSPADPLWHYLRSPEDAAPAAEHTPSPLIIVGHTHLPQLFVQGQAGWVQAPLDDCQGERALGGGRAIVNVGSVGQPRDGDWRSAYLLIDTGAPAVAFRRCRYRLSATRRAMWPLVRAAEHGALLHALVERLYAAT